MAEKANCSYKARVNNFGRARKSQVWPRMRRFLFSLLAQKGMISNTFDVRGISGRAITSASLSPPIFWVARMFCLEDTSQLGIRVMHHPLAVQCVSFVVGYFPYFFSLVVAIWWSQVFGHFLTLWCCNPAAVFFFFFFCSYACCLRDAKKHFFLCLFVCCFVV